MLLHPIAESNVSGLVRNVGVLIRVAGHRFDTLIIKDKSRVKAWLVPLLNGDICGFNGSLCLRDGTLKNARAIEGATTEKASYLSYLRQSGKWSADTFFWSVSCEFIGTP